MSCGTGTFSRSSRSTGRFCFYRSGLCLGENLPPATSLLIQQAGAGRSRRCAQSERRPSESRWENAFSSPPPPSRAHLPPPSSSSPHCVKDTRGIRFPADAACASNHICHRTQITPRPRSARGTGQRQSSRWDICAPLILALSHGIKSTLF